MLNVEMVIIKMAIITRNIPKMNPIALGFL